MIQTWSEDYDSGRPLRLKKPENQLVYLKWLMRYWKKDCKLPLKSKFRICDDCRRMNCTKGCTCACHNRASKEWCDVAKLVCKNYGFECDFIAEGIDASEVIESFGKHTLEEHGIEYSKEALMQFIIRQGG